VSLAWHGVYIYFKAKEKKRMPSLDEFRPKPRVLTHDQQRTMLEMIAARYGLPIRRNLKPP
jgi:hypothetical protein